MRKGAGLKGWIALSIGLLILGCATTKEVQTLDREVDKLHSRIDALQKENESLKNEIPVLKRNLAAENQKLKADLLLQLENLQSDLRMLSTSIDEYKELLKKPSQEIDRIREQMEARLRILEEKKRSQEEKVKELEDRLKEPGGKAPGSASKQMESEKLAATREVSAELKGISTGMGDLYKDAYETFYKGDLEGAQRKFEAFLKQYPNTELSDNAQFWIGETFYLRRDYERAILEYERAIVKYPEGDKIPAALFKQALAFYELGDKTNAKNLLRRVIEKYARSDQAEMAKKKLETIK